MLARAPTLAVDAAGPLSLFPVRTLWTIALNSALTTSPAFSGTRGYFPLEDDRLVAYDLALGTRLWIASARPQSAPAAGEGLIFLVEPGELAALREADGSVAWRLPFTEPLAVPLVWDNGWLIAASESGTVLAFRALDGHLIWRHALAARVHAPPALAADRVYVPVDDGRVVALRVETGEALWERRLGGAANEILALDDRLYVGSDDNFFYCLKTASGEVDWRWRTGGDVAGLPMADGERVYFVSFDNVLRALDRRSGAQRWKRALPLRPSAGPVAAADTIVVTGVAPTLRAFLVKDGAPAGNVSTDGEIAASPFVLDVPDVALPTLVVVAHDIAKGATVTAIARAIEPPVLPLVPLPDPIVPLTGAAPATP